MFLTISILSREQLEPMLRLCRSLELPLNLALYGRGTASRSVLDLLGIASRERRVVLSVTTEEKASALIAQMRRQLYLDTPGGGIVLSIPIKSVGGGRTLSHFTGGAPLPQPPQAAYDYELILAIANAGYTDAVMDAAREAGAAGGTILHGKGTGSAETEKFFGLSLAQEKELILIVARAGEKAAIMQSVLSQAGPGTDAGTIVFSLPVSEVAGFSLLDK